ncbi:uncharacterized protein METZ01_LOCUS379761, partial [marine metagenome]
MALTILLPGFSPHIKKSVFFDIELNIFAPSFTA